MFVYFVNSAGTKRIKIGKANDPVQRLVELQVGSAADLNITHTVNCHSEERALRIESIAHDLLKDLRVVRLTKAGRRKKSEWFQVPPDDRLQRLLSFLEFTVKQDIERKTTAEAEKIDRLVVAICGKSKKHKKVRFEIPSEFCDMAKVAIAHSKERRRGERGPRILGQGFAKIQMRAR